MADFFSKIMQAPRGKDARMNSSTMRKRGVQVHSKLVHPNQLARGAGGGMAPPKRGRVEAEGVLDKQRRLRAAKAAAAAAVIDPLNPNPEEDDLPPNKRRGHIGMGGAATPAAATAGGGSGKGYMSPGDVLRHNAAMKAAGAAVGATGTTAVQRPKARAPVSRTAVRAQSSRITRTYLAPETVGVPNSARAPDAGTYGYSQLHAARRQQPSYDPETTSLYMSMGASAYNLVGVDLPNQPMTATAKKKAAKAARLKKKREEEEARAQALRQQQQQQQQQQRQQQQQHFQQQQQHFQQQQQHFQPQQQQQFQPQQQSQWSSPAGSSTHSFPGSSNGTSLPPGMPPGFGGATGTPAQAVPRAPQPSIAQQRAALLAAAGWAEYIDGASGDPYYHNASTGSTVWDCPVDLSSLSAPVPHSQSAAVASSITQQTQSQANGAAVVAAADPAAAAAVAAAVPTQQAVVAAAPSAQLPPLALNPDWKPLKKTTIRPGDGMTWPNPDDTISVHYTGWLRNADGSSGQRFDSSHDRGRPLQFQVGTQAVIMGWDQGVMNMTLGEVARLDIGAEYGYGAQGMGDKIPPNADLLFELQVVKIEAADDGDWEDAAEGGDWEDAGVAPADVGLSDQQQLKQQQQQQQQQQQSKPDPTVTKEEEEKRAKQAALAKAAEQKAAAAAATAAVVAQAARAKAAKAAKAAKEAVAAASESDAVKAARAALKAPLPEMPPRDEIGDDAGFDAILEEYIRQQTDQVHGSGPPPEYRQQIMDIFTGQKDEPGAQENMRASMLALVREGAAEQAAKDRRAWERQQRAIQQRTLDKLLQQDQEQERAQNDGASAMNASGGEPTSSSVSTEVLGPAFGPTRPPQGAVSTLPEVPPEQSAVKPRKPGAAFAEGEKVRYTKRRCLATVLKVHTDDPAGAFYTIRIEGSGPASPGAEVQTVEAYLEAIAVANSSTANVPQSVAGGAATESPAVRVPAAATLSSSTETTRAVAAPAVAAAPLAAPTASSLRLPSVSAAPPVSVSTVAGIQNESALGGLDYGSSSSEDEDD